MPNKYNEIVLSTRHLTFFCVCDSVSLSVKIQCMFELLMVDKVINTMLESKCSQYTGTYLCHIKKYFKINTCSLFILDPLTNLNKLPFKF